MGKGFALPPVSVAALLLFGSAVLHFYSCYMGNLVSFDVPACSSISSCTKATGVLNDAPWYANVVGRSWYYANRALKLYDAVREMCNGEFNASLLPDMVSSAVSKTAPDAANVLHYANDSVSKLVGHAGTIADEMHRGGVTHVPYSDARSIYATAVDAVRAYEGNTPSTGLGKAISRYRETHPKVITLFTAAGVEVPRALIYVGKFGKVYAPRFAREILVGASATTEVLFNKVDPGEVVNAAVGTSDSVYVYAVRFLEEYARTVKAYDQSARNMLKDSRSTYEDIVALSCDLERYSSNLSPDMLALLPAAGVRESSLAEMPSSTPSEARVRAEGLRRIIEGNVHAYLRREDNYFVAYWNAERAMNDLLRVKADIERYLSETEFLAQSCASAVSKYRPYSRYVKERLPGYAAALKQNPDVSLCVQALQLMAMDKNYMRDEAILASCESSISCGSAIPADYPCVFGELSDRIDCCLRYRDRRRSEILSSDLYAQYLSLRRSVESLLAIHDDPAARAEHLSNPTDFLCESDLAKALSKETKIYIKLRKEAAKVLRPDLFVEGYLDAENVSSVKLRFVLDAGGADLLVSYDLPFQILAYRVVESNGLWISLSADGRTVHLRGSGTVLVDAETMPVNLDVEDWGASTGYRYLKVRNTIPFPVKYPFTGDVVSASDSVSYDGKYIYFGGVGEAILSVPAVEINYVVSGDRALVSLRNVSEYEYKGDVIVPVSGSKPPRNCKSIGSVSVCSVDLDPFSEDVIEIEGVDLELNTASDSFTSSFSFVGGSGSLDRQENTKIISDLNTVNSTRDAISKRLSELRSLFNRAEELNVAYLLPYSAEFLDEMDNRISETNDSVVLAAYRSVLDGIYNDVISRARALVFSVPPGTDVRSLAERALNTGDYMLAMALAASYKPERASGSSVPYASLVLGILSLALLVYYLRGQKPKKRRRIPKI